VVRGDRNWPATGRQRARRGGGLRQPIPRQKCSCYPPGRAGAARRPPSPSAPMRRSVTIRTRIVRDQRER